MNQYWSMMIVQTMFMMNTHVQQIGSSVAKYLTTTLDMVILVWTVTTLKLSKANQQTFTNSRIFSMVQLLTISARPSVTGTTRQIQKVLEINVSVRILSTSIQLINNAMIVQMSIILHVIDVMRTSVIDVLLLI